MNRFLLPAVLAVAALTHPLSAAEQPKVKKHMLSVKFKVPSSGYQATIDEVRQVGQELWVKVQIAPPKGIGLTVISDVKAELAWEGPDLPVKYLIFGKKWGWKNEEEGLIFLHDLGEGADAMTKKYLAGTVVYPVKK